MDFIKSIFARFQSNNSHISIDDTNSSTSHLLTSENHSNNNTDVLSDCTITEDHFVIDIQDKENNTELNPIFGSNCNYDESLYAPSEKTLKDLSEFEEILNKYNVKDVTDNKKEPVLSLDDLDNVLDKFNKTEDQDDNSKCVHKNNINTKENIDLDEASNVIIESKDTKNKITTVNACINELILLNNGNNITNDTITTNNNIVKKNISCIDIISISSNEDLQLSNHVDFDVSLDIISISSTDSFDTSLRGQNIDKVWIHEDIENDITTSEKNKTHKNENQIDPIKITEKYEINEINQDTCDDSNDSYHSSDFEFITENEAKMDGLIINFRPSNQNIYTNSGDYSPGINFTTIDLRRNYKEYHIIPEGDDFVNLFQGAYAPAIRNQINFLENKSIPQTKSMNVELESIGFDIKVLNKKIEEHNSDEEFREEAEDNAKRILEMYPIENRKRRRRF